MTNDAWIAAGAPGINSAIMSQAAVAAQKLGLFKLKGTMERVELLQCRWDHLCHL